MKKIFCEDEVTLYSNDTPIKIYDSRKKLFYFHPNKEKNICFNLPKGEFFTENLFRQQPFKPYEIYQMPNFSVDISKFNLIEGKNPHKATITPSQKKILIDSSIINHEYSPCLTFVLLHEIYHTVVGGNKKDANGNIIFNAEASCDNFAKNWMLSHGYNPSQIKVVKELILSDNHRKECLHDSLTQQNFRR